MTKIVILFNGPPRAGKDTAAAAAIAALGDEMAIVKFTEWVKDVTHQDLGLNCRHDAFEALKDVPLPEFGGRTPRQAYIDTSARLRREHGDDVVARVGVDTMDEIDAKIILNPDLGTMQEGQFVVDRFPAEHVLLIRIHREGHDFSNDCREWVTLDGIRTIDVDNRDIISFRQEIGRACADFVAEQRRVPVFA